MALAISEAVLPLSLAAMTVLWMGMKAPKQEKWIVANHNLQDTHGICADGGVYDFMELYSETRKRAP